MARPAHASERRNRGAGYWYVALLGALILVLGVVLAAGGVWLVSLGGSWYYLLAGIGLVVSGWLLMQQSFGGVVTYGLVWLATLVWALWEVGLQGWPLVPRLVAPTVILLLVLIAIPLIGKRYRPAIERRRPAVAARVAAVSISALAYASWHFGGVAVAQEEAPAAPAQEGQRLGPVFPQRDPALNQGGAQLAPPTQEEAPVGLARNQPGEMRPAGEDWPAWGGSDAATRYSPLDQITPQNVGQLEKAWEFRTGAMPQESDAYAAETTPLKVGDNLYLCSALNTLIAVDAVTGKEEWRYDPQVSEDAIPYSASCRGVTWYRNPDALEGDACRDRIIQGTIDARLIAVDAETGQPCAGFGNNGEISIEEGLGDTVPGWVAITAPPVVVRGIVVTGHQVKDGQAEDAPSGVIRGYDAITGELAWAWDMGNPQQKGLPPEGEVYTRGTPNMWTTATGDEELGHVYLPMGNSSVDYYGANRSQAENEYATAVVAIDVTTGDPVWHFQTVHYDVWDYDLGSQVTLVDYPAEGGSVPAMVIPSKQGEIYILDRRTGESLHPVEERQVPTNLGVEPEKLSPTQPFSSFHSLLMPDLTERDMWGMSPLDQLWCRIQFHRSTYEGVYTPPTADKRWIQYPGYNGGSDWGGIAIDTGRGIIVANYNDMPNHNRLVPREQVEELGVAPINRPEAQSQDAPEDLGPQAGAPYGIDVNAGWRVKFTGLMCKEPPYGGIRAIDLKTGETLWDRPLGTARANGPFGIPSLLPFDIGTPNNGGSVVTAGGLVFIGAATDNLFRAIDIETGETVWSTVLPAGGQANPIAFAAGGKQYVAISATGHHFMETPIGDWLIAWTLPGEPQPGN